MQPASGATTRKKGLQQPLGGGARRVWRGEDLQAERLIAALGQASVDAAIKGQGYKLAEISAELTHRGQLTLCLTWSKDRQELRRFGLVDELHEVRRRFELTVSGPLWFRWKAIIAGRAELTRRPAPGSATLSDRERLSLFKSAAP